MFEVLLFITNLIEKEKKKEIDLLKEQKDGIRKLTRSGSGCRRGAVNSGACFTALRIGR